MKWSEVIAHKELSNLPFKVELNEWGNIVRSPASNRHGYIQTQLVLELNQQKHSGTVFTECSVETSKGVKVADVVWGSSVFFSENGLDTSYQVAPEVCIEIRSPSNTRNEMQEKKISIWQKALRKFGFVMKMAWWSFTMRVEKFNTPTNSPSFQRP